MSAPAERVSCLKSLTFPFALGFRVIELLAEQLYETEGHRMESGKVLPQRKLAPGSLNCPFLLPLPPQPLQAVGWVHTLLQQLGTPLDLARVSQSGCLKVGQDSCTVDQARAERVALDLHDCCKRLEAQQMAKGLHDKETWCLFTKTANHCSIRWERMGNVS